jgi:hypothetical protein
MKQIKKVLYGIGDGGGGWGVGGGGGGGVKAIPRTASAVKNEEKLPCANGVK